MYRCPLISYRFIFSNVGTPLRFILHNSHQKDEKSVQCFFNCMCYLLPIFLTRKNPLGMVSARTESSAMFHTDDRKTFPQTGLWLCIINLLFSSKPICFNGSWSRTCQHDSTSGPASLCCDAVNQHSAKWECSWSSSHTKPASSNFPAQRSDCQPHKQFSD